MTEKLLSMAKNDKNKRINVGPMICVGMRKEFEST
jgi:hypothetical protein